ncbi:TetR/AcrR family tetracycline transcriptional repressor [Streptosporangium becharense]|uniref:TetR/AcrR family tetracycline transcriptional repressor n=1 Tax=Streptosporangium becharense TaxID=1816182 RepID=A0A7W9IJI4_9ACTN|nr:TetR/AcrR family transcriptional regulator C-terminal domain-containing protein [Streptosporangium becharense]MBB2911077.1 TetR/AcrR family tetracycline transcriptional repressor [Streptosporangium becharense]MBB5821865.1 TetR/AcrR family tetracycline transcriptional repressor [Streptosporangium becharense]
MTTTRRQDEIVEAALGLLDERGADAVSLRAVADRLGVRLNTVSWHVKTKARLLELMADVILADLSLDDLPDDWEQRIREITRRYRGALLAHRDGARIVAGTYAAERHTLRTAEAMVACLLSGGLPERDAAWACWVLVYFTLGLTQEEQGASELADTLAEAVSPHAHPALTRVFGHLAGGTFAERHDFGLDLIVRSLRTGASAGPAWEPARTPGGDGR